jgi:hypothetical protein
MDIKKNLLVLPTILLICSSIDTFAAEKCAEVSGNMIVGKAKLTCTTIKGSATFTGSTFTGKVDIIGPLKADTTKLEEIKVTGNVTLNHTIVSGAAQIKGNVTATDSAFKEKLQATSASITLNDSIAEDIEITANKPHATMYLYLNEGSTVNGNITFKNGNGIIKNNHSTLKGKVTGGKME